MTGLEALNKIDNEVLYGVYAQEHYSNELATIRKELQALEIIIEKGVNVHLLSYVDNFKDYNSEMKWSYQRLTEEDFNLLKEVL